MRTEPSGGSTRSWVGATVAVTTWLLIVAVAAVKFGLLWGAATLWATSLIGLAGLIHVDGRRQGDDSDTSTTQGTTQWLPSQS